MTDAMAPLGAESNAAATGLKEGVEIPGGAHHDATLGLESRLGDVLSCRTCSQLPGSAIYQCTRGHLICAGCLAQRLQEAREHDDPESALCSVCGLELGNDLRRNLAVEKAISELPAPCRFCGVPLPRHALYHHETVACTESPTICQLSVIGCPWRGPRRCESEHSASCPHRDRIGAQLMDYLHAEDQRRAAESSHRTLLFELLSYEKVTMKDLQLRPDQGNPPVHRSNHFTAFDCEWVVNVRCAEQSVVEHNTERVVQLEAQLELTSTPATIQPIMLHYALLRGPFGNTMLQARLVTFSYSGQQTESFPYSIMNLADAAECHRLLAAPVINIRIVMCLET